MLKVLSIILYTETCFFTIILDWTIFGLKTLDTIVILYLFCLCITPVMTESASYGGYLIN